MIIKKNFPKPELFPVVFLLLFQFLFASTPMATALNQLANPNFAAAGTWTYDNRIVWGNLNTLAWQGAGYAFGNLTKNGRHRDGMVHLNFTAPAGVVNCYVRASHQDVWVAGFTSFALTGTLRDTTVGAYPNNGLMTTFLNEVTCNHAAWTPSGWSPIVQLVAGRTYKVQTYWNCNTTAGGDCGARLDDVYCNVSPRGLVANWNGSNVDLSWSASTGVGVLSKYIVYRSTTGVSGPYVLLKDNPGGTSWTDVAPAGSYYYTVSDVETVTGDESPQSIPAVPYTFPVRDGPGPDDITYSWLTDKVEANWPVATITVMGYEVAVGTSPGGTGVVPWTPVGSANKAEFTGLSLASGTTFYTTVRALDSNGEVMGTSKSNGFTIRGDQWLVDDDGAQCFYNRRVSELIDYSTAGEIKPALMSGGGGTGLWRFRKAITITEPGITERINAPCRVFFNIPANQPGNVNEFRVTDEGGNELKRYNLPTGTTTNPDIVFIVNMKQGETKNYYVSWGNAGVSNPAYGFILGATQTSTIEWTPYYSRKLLSAGLETVPITTKFSAFDYGWDNTRDMEKPGNIGYLRDDARSDPVNLNTAKYFGAGTNFYWYGAVRNNWYVWINGLLYITNANWNYNGGSTAQWEGNTRFTGGIISPFWGDLKYDMDGYPDNPGVYYHVLTNPTRIVFTWYCNVWLSTGLEDDVYMLQTVLYPTGDVCHRYYEVSPRATNGIGGYHPANVAPNVNRTVGLSFNIAARTTWMRNTPLNVGIGVNPSSFFQCMDAFRNTTVYGAITGAAAGVVDVGHFESMVFDSRMSNPDWQTFSWDADVGGTGQMIFYVRTGTTPYLAGAWTLIKNLNVDGVGSVAIPNPPAVPDDRYIQYKCDFQRSAGPGAPVLPVLRKAQFICGGISVETVSANTPLGVSQGQDNVKVMVTFKNTYVSDVTIAPGNATLTFSLGSYTVTLESIENGGVVPLGGGTIAATFSVRVWDDSPTGTATVDCTATGTAVGPVTFLDVGAQTTHDWRVLKRAKMVITSTDTTPPSVSKGQSGVPVRAYIENTGEVPFAFSGASLTFTLGDYTISLTSPASDTIVPGPGSITALFSVDILLTSPSGVSLIDATASGTNTFSGKVVDATTSLVLDSWTIQNPSSLVLTEIIASATVFRGQSHAPLYLRAQNEGEASAIWASSTLNFTPVASPIKTYLAKIPISAFPQAILEGGNFLAQYGVDISPSTATGTDDIEPQIWYSDDNTKTEQPPYTPPVPLASWTIIAEQIRTYKDAAFTFPSAGFNQPLTGARTVFAKGTDLAAGSDFVIRWFDPAGVEVASSVILTADASGTVIHQYDLIPAPPSLLGNWLVKVTNPLNTFTACQTNFDVVSPASLTVKLSMPLSISVGQPFNASMTFFNTGGASMTGAYPSPLQTSGIGGATLKSGPTPLVQSITGYGQATFSWDYLAATPGTFTASATGYGFDANSDVFLTSDYSSCSINIQNPPNVSVFAVVATPTTVYRNQQNVEIQVRLRNTGSASAILQIATLTFSLGTYTQALSSPVFPVALAGSNAAATLTFLINVDLNSPTGVSNFFCNLTYYDSNFPASVSYVTNPNPFDTWTIATVGIILSNNIAYSPENYTFNRGQSIFARAFGLTNGAWYRIRFYDYQIANGTYPFGEIRVSPPLQAGADGTVDAFYPLPGGATLGTWSVEIDTDPDLNGTNRDGTVQAVQYCQVQTPGTLVASLTIVPDNPFEGDLITVSMVASNALSNFASLIYPATPSTLIPTTIYGGITYISGPTPASASIPAMSSGTFTWSYQAASSTGLAGTFALTTLAASSVTGIDTNTGGAANGSLKATSNAIRIYKRELWLSATNTWDLGTIGPGETGVPVAATAKNIGNATLTAVLWNRVDLNGPGTNKIPYTNLILSPSPVADGGTPLLPNATRPVSAQLTVPYNQAAGPYIATMTMFEDLSGNGNRDPLEPYVIFALNVVVPAKKNLLVTEGLVDLGNWPPGNFTGSQTINIVNIGNLDLANLRIVYSSVPATGTIPGGNIFQAFSLNPGALTVAANITTAQVSASIPAFLGPASYGTYIATWSVYDDADFSGDQQPSEASTSFQVKLAIGGKNFTLSTPVNLGVGTPSTIVPSKPLTVTNTGSLSLSALKSVFMDMGDGFGHSIASNNMSIAYPAVIQSGLSGTASVSMVIPAGTYSGNYSGSEWVYEDNNGNGSWDSGEASVSFNLMVFVPVFPAVQVQAVTVSFGDLTEGALATVTFNCKNTGNVDLTNLRWEKIDLINGGGVHLPLTEYSFPPAVPTPFGALAGSLFERSITIKVPNPQAFGDYWGNFAWLYDDTDNTFPGARVATEPQSSFAIYTKIGTVSLDILEAQISVSGDPASPSTLATYDIKNTGNLTLATPMATASDLILAAPPVPATASLFAPNPMDYVLPAQTSAGQWQVSIPPNTLPGVYTGTETAWNDANVNGLLDAIEARDTTILKLTVNSKKIINVVENPLDLGLATPGAVVKGTITIINAGNIALANLRGVTGLLDFGPGIDNIPVVNSTFTTNPIGALPIANTTYATVSVTIKNPQATGPYTGTFRVYDDVNGNGVCDGEIYKDFPVKVQIGIKAITVTSVPATFGAQNPNTSPSQGFLIKNTGSFPLANVKWMEGSMTDGTNVIPAASTTFPAPSPVPPFGMAIGFEPACSVQLVVGPYVPAGNYVGTQTVWGDVDGGGTIDPGEASATFQTTVTVNGVASMTMATDSVAFGTWKPGDTTTHIEIGFQNTGNTVLNAFTWSFLDLQKPPDLISNAWFSSTVVPAAVNPGEYATSTVWLGPLPSVPDGLYSRTGMTFSESGGASGVCSFSVDMKASGVVPPVGPGSVFQTLATSTFQTTAPGNTYVISAWVYPGTSAADIGFYLTDANNAQVGFTGVEIASTGNCTAIGNPAEVGIVESVSIWGSGGESQIWYRVYATIDYTFDQAVASSAYLALKINAPSTASYSVLIDGVQLERTSFPNQTHPTTYNRGSKIVSPNTGYPVDGKKRYYEW